MDHLVVSWTTDNPQQRVQQVRCKLLGPGGTWYDYHQNILIPVGKAGGTFKLPLTPGSWSGPYGPFDTLRKDLLNQLHIESGDISLTSVDIGFVPFASKRPNWALQPITTAPQLAGDWYEWNFRILGTSHTHPVDIRLANGQSIPAFRQQRSLVSTSSGPSIYTVRLRADEVSQEALQVVILDDIIEQNIIWKKTFRFNNYTATDLAAIKPSNTTSDIWKLPSVPQYEGWYVYTKENKKILQYGQLSVAIAPILRWNTSWTGFKGPWVSNQYMTAQLDEALHAKHIKAIDLLPQFLAEDSSTFRFGLSPWHHNYGGSWQKPQDIVSDQTQQAILLDHIREVIARSRATPSLEHWQIGLQVSSDNSRSFRQGFDQSISVINRLIKRYDDRPLIILHPEAVPFQNQHISTSWLASRNQQPIPHVAHKTLWKYEQAIDRSLWDVSRQRLTIDRSEDVPTNIGLSIYAWMIDEYHRYYQQYLGYMAAGESRRVVYVDWMASSAWESGSHTIPWHGDLKRRVRKLGLQLIADKPINNPDSQQISLTNAIDQQYPLQEETALAVHFMDPQPPEIAAWKKYEQRFKLNHGVDNPYDPAQANVVAEVKDPDGNISIFPAFWYEPMEIALQNDGKETVTTSGLGYWMWRYAFNRPGAWQVRFIAELHNGNKSLNTATHWHAITVAKANDRQLLPISQSEDPRYWQTSDGKWFYPMGISIRSPGDNRQNTLMEQAGSTLRSQDWENLGTHAYQQWFAKLNAHGGNYVRMWMAPWWTALEWHRKWDGYQGLGRYNQANAARLDRIIADAERHNIYLQLELASHGMTSEDVDEQWAPGGKRNTLGSPYNAINGGPVKHAAEFYSDEEAWTYHQRRLRYTVARWGWAPHIMSWVLSSEMEFTGAYWREGMRSSRNGHSPTLAKWIDRNLAWFQANDLQQRPVSIHFSHPWRARKIWEKKGLGFSYSNAYTGFQQHMGQLGRPRSGLGGALLTFIGRHFRPHNLKRPTLIGEWGGHWQEQRSETLAAEWRTGLWMQAVLPYSGNTGFWWWLWVDASDSWKQMAPVRKFVMDEDPRGQELKPIITRVRHPRDTAQRLRMVAAKGPNHIVAYAYHEWYDFAQYKPSPQPEQRPKRWPSVRFETGKANQAWLCKRYSTQTGDVIKTYELTSNEKGQLVLFLEDIEPDAVFRLSFQGETP